MVEIQRILLYKNEVYNMDPRIQELIDVTKTKFGLDSYYLQRHSLYRKVNILNETVYTLCMEWFPNHAIKQEDDDSNPDGTAVIELNVNSGKFESVIFVMGKTYAEDGVSFAGLDLNDIIKWIEKETGLEYEKQFHLHKEEQGDLFFKECISGVAVSPSGSIEVKFNQNGNLIFFAIHGEFPSKEIIKEEIYTLSLEMVEHLAKEQLKLVEFPSYEQKRLSPVYAVEEIYVTNDQTSMIPFEVIVDTRSYLEMDEAILWDEPINNRFERKEISWIENITPEQAFSCEPSPNLFPITKVEQDKCIMAIKDVLRQEYPSESGKWMLKTLHRDKGYIHAVLRATQQDNRVFQRKLMIIIDAVSLQVINYIDNKPMLEVFDEFQAPEEVIVTKEEAFEKMKDLFELKPFYVYDVKQNLYVLCGKLDCHYGVNAGNGEVIALDDL